MNAGAFEEDAEIFNVYDPRDMIQKYGAVLDNSFKTIFNSFPNQRLTNQDLNIKNIIYKDDKYNWIDQRGIHSSLHSREAIEQIYNLRLSKTKDCRKYLLPILCK